MAVRFSRDSRRLAVVDTWDSVLTVFDVDTGTRASEVSSGPTFASPLVFTADGDAIAPVVEGDDVIERGVG